MIGRERSRRLSSHTSPAAMPSRAMQQDGDDTTAAIRASHLICCRIRRPPARYRTASDTTRRARKRRTTTDSPLRRADQGPPQGRRQVLDAQRVPVEQRDPARSGQLHQPWRHDQARPVRPVSRMPAAATGRQRGDGSFPVGKSRNMTATLTKVRGMNDALRQRPTSSPRERPGCAHDPGHRVAGGRPDERQPDALAEHDPADQVSRAADDQHTERGVGDRCHRVKQARNPVAELGLAPCDEGQGRPASAASSVAAHNAAVMRLTDRIRRAVRSGGPAVLQSSALAGARSRRPRR